MNSHYRKFYKGCYSNTNGFIPAKPLSQLVFPGDFFQIRKGEMIILGNIFRSGIIDPHDAAISRDIRHHQASWHFGEGVSKPYAGRGHGKGPIEGHFEFSRQKLSFENSGSYFFKGNDPRSIRIANWNELQQQCIIKLTQTVFSFRELYLVTETASASDWTLAISGCEHANLEIATDKETFGLTDIFGHHAAKTVEMHGMEFYHRQTERSPTFFKAKKLVVQDEKLSTFVSDLVEERLLQNEWASGFFQYNFTAETFSGAHVPMAAQASILDKLQANELNPNTALLYFKWVDASLDDVEKYFTGYGNG